MNIVSAVILCTIVGAVGAIILVAAAKFMAVEEDPRIEEVSADRKSTRLNSSHQPQSRMPSSA